MEETLKTALPCCLGLNPLKKMGYLQIMYGNLCPGGGIANITGKEEDTFTVRRERERERERKPTSGFVVKN
jgi:dihydroxyacid dehydratase/phosphogluconate dehydratase